jgi:hypothetical protein
MQARAPLAFPAAAWLSWSMGITVVGHYASLPEARVACCALHSAGFPAWVFDEQFGTMVWTQQLVLRGFRLVVPAVVGREAWEFLRAIQPPPQKIDPKTRTLDFWFYGFLVVLAWGSAWSWVAYRAGPTRWRAVGFGVQFCLFLALDLYVFVRVTARLFMGLLRVH